MGQASSSEISTKNSYSENRSSKGNDQTNDVSQCLKEGNNQEADMLLNYYLSNLKNSKNLQEFLHLNQETFGDAFCGLDKFATGTVFGLCSGFATRKAFRFAALVFGASFISLQILQYQGYITIEWKTIEKELTSYLDLNKDGQLNSQDVALAKQKFLRMLTWGLPSAGGFSTGFLLGFRGYFI